MTACRRPRVFGPMSARRSAFAIGAVVFGLSAVTGQAGEPAPSPGCSSTRRTAPVQLAQDRYECHDWASPVGLRPDVAARVRDERSALDDARVPMAAIRPAGAMAKGTLAGGGQGRRRRAQRRRRARRRGARRSGRQHRRRHDRDERASCARNARARDQAREIAAQRDAQPTRRCDAARRLSSRDQRLPRGRGCTVR